MSTKLSNHTIVIFEKGGVFGIMSIDKYPKTKAIVSRYDPREKQPFFRQTAETLKDGLNLMAVTVQITESRGWKAVYTGGRNWG